MRRWILTGWPENDTNEKFEAYIRRKDELSIEEGCVLWGSRAVIPEKGRARVVRMLHEAHPGIVRMKNLARGYVWWPGIDKQLKDKVKSCETCQTNRKSLPVTPLHPWSWPQKPWSRVHIDYAGPFMGKMFLLVINAYSKWLDIHVTNATSLEATINLLRKSFASLGLPEVLVSDNAPNFTSQEFEVFTKKNSIKHVRTPPYHPASNGLVERAVQTFKEGMRKQKDGTVETKLSRFLFKYRITPHSSTGTSPAELIYGRRLLSHLDCILPDLKKKVRDVQQKQKQNHDRHARNRVFQLDDLVYVKSYGSGKTWEKGKVIGKLGETMYTVLMDNGRCVRKHSDQLKIRVESDGVELNDDDDEIDIPLPSEKDSNDVNVDARSDTPSPAQPDDVVAPRRSDRQRRPPDRYGH